MSENRVADRQRLVGCLAGGVAHDFNNLLATVLGCLELMERRTGDAERMQTLIRRASDAVDRAASLTSALVHFARRTPQLPHEIDLAEAVRGVVPLIASALGRRIKLTTDLHPDTPRIEADLAAVESCLVALCLAAREVAPEGGEVALSSGPGFEPVAAEARKTAVITVQVRGTEIGGWNLELLSPSAIAANATIARTDPNQVSLAFYAAGS